LVDQYYRQTSIGAEYTITVTTTNDGDSVSQLKGAWFSWV